MRNVLRVLALAVVVLSAAPVYAADVNGTWEVDGNVYGNQVTYTFEVKQAEDGKLTGTAKFATSDQPAPVTGTIADKQVTWQFDVPYQGQTYTLVYTATLASDTPTDIAGKISVAGVEGQFTAKKQQPK